MRCAGTDPELMGLIRRFVTPGRRYLRLGGSSLRLSGPERELFVRELVQDAREITPAELGILFEGGWRERKTASWLVVAAGRTEFRGRIGELLLASGGPMPVRPTASRLPRSETVRTPIWSADTLITTCFDQTSATTKALLLARCFTSMPPWGPSAHPDTLPPVACGSSGLMSRRAWCGNRRSTGSSWTSSVPSPASALNSSPDRKPDADPRPDRWTRTAEGPSVGSGP